MQPDIPLLQQTILFSGIEAEELRHLLTCLGGFVRRYGRGEFLWHAGDTVLQAGIVLQGAVDAVQYREDGAMQLVARHTAGGVFGEMLMAAGEASPVSVLSPEGAEVLFLPLERIMEGCERHCEGHARLRMNLLRESAQKFWQMRHRVTYLSEPSLRRRVLLYLQDCRSRQGSDCFRLSLSREEMAAYLAVNRSALSRELSRLQQEGFIEFYRNSFRLHFSPEQLSVTEM